MALKSKKSSSFQYKPRTKEQVKERANRKAGLYDSIFKQGVDEYRPKTGDNVIRYLPPTWDDSEHYGFTAFVHNNVGPDNAMYLCPRKMLSKPCPICEASKEAKDAGENEEAKALNTSERVVSYVLDRDGDDPEKPLVYNQSWTQDRDVTSLCVNERSGEILMIDHPDSGFDVSFKRTGTGLKTKYYGWQVDRSESPIHDKQSVQDEILEYVKDNPIPDQFNFFDYDYLKGVLTGAVPEKDKDLDEDDEPVKKTSTKSHRGPRRDEEVEEEEEDETPKSRNKKAAVVEDDEEELDLENEEEEVRHPRSSTKKSRRAEPEDEEVNEEEEDEAPPPRRASGARARVVEDEEEEEEAEEEAPRQGRSNRR